MDTYSLPLLPPTVKLETEPVLKALSNASRALAELKGYADTIPNKDILINAITINEAKDSSEIENIVTTHDELYRALSSDTKGNLAAKEVVSYRRALWQGYEKVKASGMLTTNMIVEIQSYIEHNRAGIRKLPGTILQNQATGDTIYTPPSGEADILKLMSNLERYINESVNSVDPLIKLAVIHYQFESIHPFYDGNGRTGRIVNVLYLVLTQLLDSPIVYLSRYIIRRKEEYYRLLQRVRITGSWEEWIVYMLVGVEQTAKETLRLVKRINALMKQMTEELKTTLPKLYSKELLDLLFFEFYTKTPYIMEGLSVSRITASGYLKSLEDAGFLVSEKIGKERIYKNKRLYDLVANTPDPKT